MGPDTTASRTRNSSQLFFFRLLITFQLYILSYIGIASALGHTLIVPIVVRSLAGVFALVRETELPLEMTPTFLATLDTGKYKNVKRYHLQWWTNRKPQDLNKVQILAVANAIKCLNHFNQEKLKTNTMPGGAGAGAVDDDDSLELRPVSHFLYT